MYVSAYPCNSDISQALTKRSLLLTKIRHWARVGERMKRMIMILKNLGRLMNSAG